MTFYASIFTTLKKMLSGTVWEFLYQISPKSVDKYGKYTMKFVYAPKYSRSN